MDFLRSTVYGPCYDIYVLYMLAVFAMTIIVICNLIYCLLPGGFLDIGTNGLLFMLIRCLCLCGAAFLLLCMSLTAIEMIRFEG